MSMTVEQIAAEALRRRDKVRAGRVKTIPIVEALARVRRAVARDKSRPIREMRGFLRGMDKTIEREDDRL